jgi:excisionase family DNA binding protein
MDMRSAGGTPAVVSEVPVEELPMASRTHEPEPLLTPAEVASMFRVDPKTVTRWAKAGKLSAIRTLGGHRRYRESEVRALLQGQIPQQRVGD